MIKLPQFVLIMLCASTIQAQPHTDELKEIIAKAHDDLKEKRYFAWVDARERMKILLFDMYDPADPNVQVPDGGSALHIAAGFGDIELIEILLNVGVHVDIKDSDGKTPLFWAVIYGQLEALRTLIKHKANVNARDNWDQIALMWAVTSGHSFLIPILVDEYGSGVNLVSACDDQFNGFTAFAFAVECGKVDAAELLVKCGANCNLLIRGAPSIIVAVDRGHSEIVNLLLSFGLDRDVCCQGWTPLSEASFLGHLEIVRVLIAAGANVNFAPRKPARGAMGPGTTWYPNPLESATNQGRNEVKDFLIANGACTLGSCLNPIMGRIQTWAASNDGRRTVDILKTLKNPFQNTVLHLALIATSDHALNAQVVALLISQNLADGLLDTINSAGVTPMTMAFMQGNSGAALVLLNAGASPIFGNPNTLMITRNRPDLQIRLRNEPSAHELVVQAFYSMMASRVLNLEWAATELTGNGFPRDLVRYVVSMLLWNSNVRQHL